MTDYSPDSQVPGPLRGPAGTGRMEIVREPANYGWPLCMTPDLPMYEWNFNTSRTLGEPHGCDDPTQGPPNASRHNTGLSRSRRRSPSRTSGTPTRTPTWGTPCFEGYNTPVAQPCANLFPELGDRRRRPARCGEVRVRPGQPEPDEVPAVLRRRRVLRRVHAGHAQGDPARRGQRDLQDQPAAELRRRRVGRRPRSSSATTRWTCSSGPTARSTCSRTVTGSSPPTPTPACTSGSTSRASARRRPCSARRRRTAWRRSRWQFSSEGSRDPDPSDSIEFAWDFDERRQRRLDRSEPDVHVHAERRVHGAADGHGLERQDRHADDDDHRRATRRRTCTLSHAGRRRLLRLGRRRAVHGDRHRSRGRADRLLAGHRHVRARARPARSRRGLGDRAAPARCRPRRTTRRTAATSPAGSACPTRTTGPTASRR